MMKKTLLNKKGQHMIDLTKIDCDGAFPCPKCAVVISPEDESEEIYKIEEIEVINNELVELTIMCKNCKTNMELPVLYHVIES